MNPDRTLLLALFQAALDAARPDGKFDGRLPMRPRGRTLVLGAGKAAGSMAAAFERAVEAAWGEGALDGVTGLVVTRYGHAAPTRRVVVREAAHPVPDAAGVEAAATILALARSATADDLVVVLVSGGASALLSLPAPGITLDDKRALFRALLASGAPIGVLNRIRPSLSAVKGGRLAAAAAPAPVVTYAISDIPGDDPAVIGSGPTLPDQAGPEEALDLLARWRIPVPPGIAAAMRANPPPALVPGPVHLVATPRLALEAAARVAREAGVAPLILGDAIEGEAREAARVLAGIALSVARHGTPAAPPCVLLSGGETTVTVRGGGRGGRNAEFLLALGLALGGAAGISALAADTDGIDGSESNAGAVIDAALTAEALAAGLDLAAALERNDAYTPFEALGRLVVTGPTLTNVNDFRAILVR